MNKPSNQLDQLAQKLGQKHRARLETITRTALPTPQPTAHPSWRGAWAKPLLASAIAASVAIAAVLLEYRQETAPPLDFAALPTWVNDTEVPLALLENMAFYDWLSQQPGNQAAQAQNWLILADGSPAQFGFSGRYPPAHLTQGSPRNPAAGGETSR